jgi:Flp pilus assembly protein CpaB
VASAASLLLYRFLASSRPQAATAAPPMAHVVVAVKDLEIGRVLKEDDQEAPQNFFELDGAV